MLFSTFAVLLLSISSLAYSQLVATLPQCIQNCIAQSDDENCSASDIKCLCRASAGNFLPDIITCMHGNCDNDLDDDVLLTPLQLVCQIAGTPIPGSAIRNAENQASSLAGQVTTTVTMIGGGVATSTTTSMDGASRSLAPATATSSSSTSSTLSRASLTTSTFSGLSPSHSSSAATSSPSTTSGVNVGEVSSSSILSTTILTTGVALNSTSSSADVASRTSSASQEDSTNSSPFKNTNSGSTQSSVYGLRLWLSVLVVGGWLWL